VNSDAIAKNRIEEFFARLQADEDTAMLAIMLGPHRFAIQPAELCALIERLTEHWQATAPMEAQTT